MSEGEATPRTGATRSLATPSAASTFRFTDHAPFGAHRFSL